MFLRPAAENPRSTLPGQVSESADIWIRDPIGVPRCSPQSGIPDINRNDAARQLGLVSNRDQEAEIRLQDAVDLNRPARDIRFRLA
jgi:hypothetical protein